MASVHVRYNKGGKTAYVVRAYVCRDAKGRSKYISKTYVPEEGWSEKKVEKKIKALCAELDEKAKNKYALDGSQKFAAYCLHFMEKKQSVCSEYTLHSYRIALDKACEYLGAVPLEKINARHLDELRQGLAGSNSQYGKEYSPAYIRHVQTLVRMVLGMAVKERILAVNPADSDHYTLPSAGAKEPVFLELEEAREYLRCAKEEPDPKIKAMVLLYLYTGMRMEELCGLEWSDIDFGRREIHINRASVYVAGLGVITKTPKTKSSLRIVSADPAVFEALAQYRLAKEKERKAAKRWQESGRIFTKRNGLPVIPNTTASCLKRFAKANGLRPVTPHKLRHTFATLQIAYGTDIRTVAGVMGHSSPVTTLNIYAHQIREASRKAANAMSEMLSPKATV